MIPTQDLAHVAELQGLLTEVFKRSTNINGILKAVGNRIQELENAIFDYIAKVPLTPSSVGDLLDKYGKILDELRNGRTDTEYYPALILKARVLRSNGLAEDIIQVGFLTNHDALYYVETGNASYFLILGNLQGPLTTATFLSHTRAGGVKGQLVYTTWPDGTDFVWGSTYDATVGEDGYGSTYDTTVGGFWAAASVT